MNGVTHMVALIDLPAVVVSGITVSGLPAPRAGGLTGVAVVSAIYTTEDPRSVTVDPHRVWDEECWR